MLKSQDAEKNLTQSRKGAEGRKDNLDKDLASSRSCVFALGSSLRLCPLCVLVLAADFKESQAGSEEAG
jgi:hypothetical protein